MSSILFIAFIVEKIVEILSEILPILNTVQKEKVNVKSLIALLVSLVICIGANIDILYLTSVQLNVPYAGNIISALLMSSSSEVLHDIIDWIKANKTIAKSS